ncbi:MAG: DevR family CRISPR-associated autoregulator [Deltaproteobacteria bacterium]|nr:DevR family CRISPR-associated autoregulator [Deltaproteobacteria bacterium]
MNREERPRAITATVVYNCAALNRGENLAGNIGSVKKLALPDGVYSFISRPAIRHYLFDTLVRLFGWSLTPVTKENKVLQFDIKDADTTQLINSLINYPEIDVFGFMKTAKSEKTKKNKDNPSASSETKDNPADQSKTITRKAVLGITKCISLFPFREDIIFYANHHMVARASPEANATPDPYAREEHQSLFKVSFVLDCARLTRLDDEASLYGKNGSDDGLNKHRFQKSMEIFQAITQGLTSQSSGEVNTLVPVFFIVGGLKLPIPVFHNFITAVLDRSEDGRRKFKILGVETAIKHPYRVESFQPIIYYVPSVLMIDADGNTSYKESDGKLGIAEKLEELCRLCFPH